MTERKMTYLTGLDSSNGYERNGAYLGGAGGAFGFAALLRMKSPAQAFSQGATRFLCGNLDAPSQSTTRGWGLLWQAGPQPAGNLVLAWGDDLLAQRFLSAAPVLPATLTQRTLLLHGFFIADPDVAGAENLTAMMFCNGASVAVADGVGFTPAAVNKPYRVGGKPQCDVGFGLQNLGAAGVGLAGVSFYGLQSSGSFEARQEQVQALVDRHTAACIEIDDMADDALCTSFFSARLGLPNPVASWLAQKGSAPSSLAEVGGMTLAVEAAISRYGDVQWNAANLG
jgi:hypothetical protein